MVSNTTHTIGQNVPLVSIIVPTYKRTQFLRDTVVSLRQQTLAEGFEILVVDNAPSDELREYVQSLVEANSPPIRYIPEPRTGLHYARHAGTHAAHGEILVYVDDDVLTPPGWLEAICEPYSDPKVACVGGKTVAKWEAVPPEWIKPLVGGPLSILDMGEETRDLTPGEYVYGCNMSVRKRVFYEIGGFNPDYYGDRKLIWYVGDGECGLVDKIFAAGYRVVYEPRAWLYHRIPKSRMTPEYFSRRLFIRGIESSYTKYRSHPVGATRLLLQAGVQGMYCGYQLIRCLMECPGTTKYVRRRMALSSRKARALHALRLCFSPKLRAHVTRKDYLE